MPHRGNRCKFARAMAFDEILAARVREAMLDRGELAERKMFGGLALMLNGHLCCGVIGVDLMLRVGPAAYPSALARPHARAMDFTGRPLTGYVYVAPAGLRTRRALDAWVERAAAFVLSLPAPSARKKRKPKPRRHQVPRGFSRFRGAT
jgi:TfoX/Sxy family transcriptional regulator of competence genes